MNDKKKIFLNSAAVFTATIMDNALFFILNIIIARYLSIDSFGEYTTALGYATFFATMTDIGINAALQRMVSREPESARYHFGNVITIKTLLALLAYGAMSVSLLFTNYSSNIIYLTLIMGLFRMGNEYHSTFYSLFDAQEKFLFSSFVRSSFGIMVLAGSIAVILMNGDIFDLAWVRCAVVAVYALFLVFFSIRALRPKVNRKTYITFIRTALPFGASSIINNFYQRLNLIILSLIHGSVYTGVFTNGYMFFTTLFFIPGNFSRVLLPYLYRVDFRKDKDKFQFAFDFYSKYLAIAGFYCMIIIILFSHAIILLLFGTKYDQSKWVLRISALGIPFIFTIGSTIIAALDRQHDVTKIQCIGLIFNIPANLLLIYYFKSEGAAIASVLTYALINWLYMVFLARQGFISIRNHHICFIKLSVISLLCLLLWYFDMRHRSLILAVSSVSALFIIPTIALLIRRDDLRIFRDIFLRK